MKIEKINEYWTNVDGRSVYTGSPSSVILTKEESLVFDIDDDLRTSCAEAARLAGAYGLVACHTLGGVIIGTVKS